MSNNVSSLTCGDAYARELSLLATVYWSELQGLVPPRAEVINHIYSIHQQCARQTYRRACHSRLRVLDIPTNPIKRLSEASLCERHLQCHQHTVRSSGSFVQHDSMCEYTCSGHSFGCASRLLLSMCVCSLRSSTATHVCRLSTRDIKASRTAFKRRQRIRVDLPHHNAKRPHIGLRGVWLASQHLRRTPAHCLRTN